MLLFSATGGHALDECILWPGDWTGSTGLCSVYLVVKTNC